MYGTEPQEGQRGVFIIPPELSGLDLGPGLSRESNRQQRWEREETIAGRTPLSWSKDVIESTNGELSLYESDGRARGTSDEAGAL